MIILINTWIANFNKPNLKIGLIQKTDIQINIARRPSILMHKLKIINTLTPIQSLYCNIWLPSRTLLLQHLRQETSLVHRAWHAHT